VDIERIKQYHKDSSTKWTQVTEASLFSVPWKWEGPTCRRLVRWLVGLIIEVAVAVTALCYCSHINVAGCQVLSIVYGDLQLLIILWSSFANNLMGD